MRLKYKIKRAYVLRGGTSVLKLFKTEYVLCIKNCNASKITYLFMKTS